jgi:hypothetical protein
LSLVSLVLSNTKEAGENHVILLVRSLSEIRLDSLTGLQNGFFLWKTKGTEMKGVSKMGMQKLEN